MADLLEFMLGPPRRQATVVPADYPDDYTWAVTRKTQAGIYVNENTALTYAAVWCATRVLCEPAAALPLITYERVDDNDREEADDYPIYDLLKSSPNEDMEAQPFWEGR